MFSVLLVYSTKIGFLCACGPFVSEGGKREKKEPDTNTISTTKIYQKEKN